ncbi:hypothetical protein Bpfe_009107, partial [Biomphalaria pfeifferi]
MHFDPQWSTYERPARPPRSLFCETSLRDVVLACNLNAGGTREHERGHLVDLKVISEEKMDERK